MENIHNAIPHRPPFLYVDEIVSMTDDAIEAVKTISPDEPFFKGHYPGFPIMPGVLVCEAIFQAGAILLSRLIDDPAAGVPVLTRINGAKFRNMVRPGDRIELHAELTERVSNVFYMKGKAAVKGKTAVTVEYACALAKREDLMKQDSGDRL